MTKQLEKLVVQLEAKTASYEQKLKKASEDARRWSDKAKEATRNTSSSFNGLGSNMNKFGQSVSGVTNAFRIQKGAVSQLSMQLQDVAVQAQMGANNFTILGQQGSQIASLFGPGGAVLGAIVAVSAGIGGVLAKAMGDVNEEIITLEKRVDAVIGRTYRARMKEVNFLVEEQTKKVKELRQEFDYASELISRPIKIEGASYVYGSNDEREAMRAQVAEKRIARRLEAIDNLAEAEARLNLLVEERASLEADMKAPDIEAELAAKNERVKAAQERVQLEESVLAQIERINFEKYNPIEREKKIHEERLALFKQYKDLELGSEKDHNLMIEQEDMRHQEAMKEAQLQHYLEKASAFENLLMQYHEAAQESSTIISETMVEAMDNFITSFSYSMAAAIVQGESLAKTMENVGKAMVTHVLGSLIKLGTQMLVNSLFAEQIQAIQMAAAKVAGTAIASAYAPAAAMASLASFGSNAGPAAAGISSTVALAESLALAGMAHDGIDNIPSEGTWLLDRGERVLSADQNLDLTNFLAEMKGSGNDLMARNSVQNWNITMSGEDFFSANTVRRFLEKLSEEAGDSLNVRVITV